MIYQPTPNPDKILETGGKYDFQVSSTNKPIFLAWVLPTNFIQVDPKLSLVWTYCGERQVNVEWEVEYYYMNQSSYLGYFNDDGSIVMNFDDGYSKSHRVVLKTIGEVVGGLIQETIPHKLIKKGRRTGTLIGMAIKTEHVDEVYFMGARIEYTRADIPRDPIGRKRTYKIRYDEDE